MAGKIRTIDFERRMKYCAKCDGWLPFDKFAKGSKQSHGFQAYCKPCCLIASREYSARHPGCRRKTPRTPEQRRNEKKTDRKWTPAQREKKNARQRAYRVANAGKIRMWNKLRVHRIRGGGPMPHPVDIGAMLCEQEYICPYCNQELANGYHIDHKTPISRGGTNDEENLHMVCGPCNLKKHDKTHDEFVIWLSDKARFEAKYGTEEYLLERTRQAVEGNIT